jgi:hypothetical protein
MTSSFKFLFYILIFMVLSAVSYHRFYTSIFQINYVPQKKMVQITTRIFIDDFNDALKNQYHKTTFLGTNKETQDDINLMKKYVSEKFKLTVNGKFETMNYLSNEKEDNVLICYFKINDISKLKSLKIENTILTEVHSEQQNIIQFNNNGTKSSLLFSGETTKGMLK